MEAAVRCLRDGRQPGAPKAPLLIIEDSIEALGGPAYFFKALEQFLAAVAAQRAQCQLVTLAAFDRAPGQYAARCGEAAAGGSSLHVIDCFRDPWGWAGEASTATGGGTLSSRGVVRTGPKVGDGLPALWRAIVLDPATGLERPAESTAVVLDSLSSLFARYPHAEALAWLGRLVRHPATSCVLATLHTDLVDSSLVGALDYMAAGVVELTGATALERVLRPGPGQGTGSGTGSGTGQGLGSGLPAHTQAQLLLKRRNGRVAVETELLALTPGGGLVLQRAADTEPRVAALQVPQPPPVAPPSRAAPGPGALVAVAAAAAQLAGGMRLDLSEQELEARKRVVLPYEHAGAGSRYETGDARDYLPPAAGGRGAGAPATEGGAGLGHILYVRDSESEYDSDEDPDEDLDI